MSTEATSAATTTPLAPPSSNTVATIFINPYATVSVKTHVPISLELHHPNFNKWKTFRSMCGKFGLLDHLDAVPPANPDASWEQAEFCIRSWLFGSVSDDVLDLAMEPDQTARALWLAIDNLFQANKQPRAMFLHHEFHSMIQVILDDFSHFCWTFPLRHKSEVHGHITNFVAYAHTQFGRRLKALQADNGTEFVNHNATTFLASRGCHLRLSCPYTSPQNGKAKRVIHTLNNSVRTLLLQASMPPSYWAEALATATYLLNRRPSSSVRNSIPFQLLHNKLPDYSLRVFGCLCYPNISATSAHKLAPRSAACVFLGYPTSHKGYHCFDPSTRRIIISRHVFDETRFPFAHHPVDVFSFDFLLQGVLPSPVVAPPNSGVEQPQPATMVAPSPEVEQLLLYQTILPAHGTAHDAGFPTPPSLGAPSAAGPPARLVDPFPLVYQRRSAPSRPATPPQDVDASPPSPPAPRRPITRSQTGSLKPVDRLILSASHTAISPVPANYRSALADPNWRAAMADEYKALMDNGTWRLVPHPQVLTSSPANGYSSTSSIPTAPSLDTRLVEWLTYLLYVDDIILTASSPDLLQLITAQLHSEFAMTDLGYLHFFLGISVTHSTDGLFLSQRQYAVDLLQRAGMSECHPTATPVDARAKLSASDGVPVKDPTEYRSLAGPLQYLTLTRPELTYAVQQVCLFMHDPREPHLALIKRILRYVKGSLSAGLHISIGPLQSLTAYSDADWAGCPDSRR
uniref:Integrase catalytic domain-containing protein n=1 Tax=Oryza brachyantha TaxID=4533 RepID=J3MVH8_ORYBR